MTAAEQQRRGTAWLRLVGRGLLEGLVAGAALGLFVLLGVWLLTFVEPSVLFQDAGLRAVVVFSFYAVAVGTPIGLAGAVLALVVLGVVARWHREGWTTSRAAWLAPAVAVGVTTTTVGVVGDGWWWFVLAALPAAGVTAWRVRGAVTRFAATYSF